MNSILKLFIDEYDHVPFDALTYVTSECNYGGRVTDQHDRRLINSLLNIYYSPDIITNDKYNFCSLSDFHVPGDLSYDAQIEFIRGLPVTTLPETLGLHSNAKISRDYQETQQLFNDILLTLPREVCSCFFTTSFSNTNLIFKKNNRNLFIKF